MVNKKRVKYKKLTNREYHLQNNKYIEHQYVKIYCTKNQFLQFLFCVPHNKPHGVHRLSNHYHMCFYPKLGHGTCTIRQIPCAYTQCTSTLYKPWTPGVSPRFQQCYQPVKY